MGTVTRHVGAPWTAGQILTAADLEADVGGAITQINGNIDDTNVKSTAGIQGSKLADASIATAKIQSSAITTTLIAANAATKGAKAYTAGSLALTGSYATIATVSYTTAANTAGDVLVIMSILVTETQNVGSTPSLQLLRDPGANVLVGPFGITVTPSGSEMASVCYLDTGLSAATSYTWYVQGKFTTGLASVSLRSITVREFIR